MNEFENSPEWKNQLKAENGQNAPQDEEVSAYQALYRTLEQPQAIAPPPDLAETVVSHLSRVETRERWKAKARYASVVVTGVTGAVFSLPRIYTSALAANETLVNLPWLLIVFILAAMLLANTLVFIRTHEKGPENG